MKKISEGTINVFRGLRTYLPPKDFKKNLEMQLKDYEITIDFLEAFIEDLDSSTISKLSLDPDCIRYLIRNDKFDYNAWKENIKYKNIDILADDDFVSTYCGGLEDSILAEASNITTPIYNRYINDCDDSARKNILIRYNGPEVDINKIADNIHLFSIELFSIPVVQEDLKKENSIIAERFLSTSQPVDLILFLALLNKTYVPKLLEEKIDDMVFNELDLTETNPDATKLIDIGRKYVINIFERYPVDVASAVIKNVFWYGKNILMSKDLLRQYLIECNDIPEECLSTICEIFIITNCREELVAYAKNYEYRELLVAIKLI